MSRQEQARAYLQEANRTLEGARILFERREEGYAQVVNNAYAALEQALSAGIADEGHDIPRDHGQKVLKFFEIYDEEPLQQKCLKWQSLRESARYVDFEGMNLSVPEENFDADDAAEILEDAEKMIEFVETRLDDS